MALQKNEIYTIRESIVTWVDDVASKTAPDEVIWCDGSSDEYEAFIRQMLKEGKLISLDQKRFPNCYLHRSDPNDVARTEASTFICTPKKEEVGATNNWMNDVEAQALLWRLFDGCMRGRAMYVVPYVLGPIDSKYSQVGIELTDSLYVAASLRIMTRMGKIAIDRLKGQQGEVVRGVHSMGTMDPKLRYICHFPDAKLIMSINSNYGGNALLSKKSHSLRLASVMARGDGDWLAEHMLIVGVADRLGNTTYITGAFPSASGKTNLAMLRPPPDSLTGYDIQTVGDDIAWLRLAPDGRLHAINPEAGFFCVAPGTNEKTNPNLVETIRRNTIYTNVGLDADGAPWWEGGPPIQAKSLIDWHGKEWKPGGTPAAHPNSRFTTPVSQYPNLSPRATDPAGVPVSAILFGGRRAELVPLVYETFSWEHGVLAGAMMKVETTAAAEGAVGRLRSDPMAMIPFCGYNISDYFRHWLSFGHKSKKLPRIFQVNWFRKGKDNKFLWPGYGENTRVLKWIIDRVHGRADAVETPIGYVPAPGSLDLRGTGVTEEAMRELLRVDRTGWLGELASSGEFFKTLGERFPRELWDEYERLKERLQDRQTED